MQWVGYILLNKPAALSLADWQTALLALYRALDRMPDAPQPYQRLHFRLNDPITPTKVIMCAAFDTSDLTLDQLATYIANSLAGKYTQAQVKTALTNNVTLWRMGEDWNASGDDCRAYLAANAAAWEAAGGV